MLILGIDPGPEQSAGVVWDGAFVACHIQKPNAEFREHLINLESLWPEGYQRPFIVAIEDVAYYGKVLNRSTFDTLKMIGRIQEIFDKNHACVFFPDIAYHFCNSRRGVNTAQINKVLVDRFGGKGTKKNPGPLYGIREHEWSALAVAVYYAEAVLPAIKAA
ncbi:MAG: hypothetical protein WC455_26350 [Dehalococcoidia bacterium]|jgi:hypothetical protein